MKIVHYSVNHVWPMKPGDTIDTKINGIMGYLLIMLWHITIVISRCSIVSDLLNKIETQYRLLIYGIVMGLYNIWYNTSVNRFQTKKSLTFYKMVISFPPTLPDFP